MSKKNNSTMKKSVKKDPPPKVTEIISKQNTKLHRLFTEILQFFSNLLPSSFLDSKKTILHDEDVNNLVITKNKLVEDIMTPRSDIIFASHAITVQDLTQLAITSGHTRIPIYKDTLDKIIGFVHIKDLFKLHMDNKASEIKKIIRKHIVSPHSMRVMDLLTQMQIQRTHIAVVVDEYGGTDGIVTMDDILQEIVGKIDDEHDDQSEINSFSIIKPGVVLSSSRVEIEDLEAALNIPFRLEHDEVDTIGGLVMSIAGRVPEKGEVVKISDNISVEVLDCTPRTIKQLRINILNHTS